MELHRTRGSGIGDWFTLIRKPKVKPTSPDRVHRELDSAPQSFKGRALTIVGGVILVVALLFVGYVLSFQAAVGFP